MQVQINEGESSTGPKGDDWFKPDNYAWSNLQCCCFSDFPNIATIGQLSSLAAAAASIYEKMMVVAQPILQHGSVDQARKQDIQ